MTERQVISFDFTCLYRSKRFSIQEGVAPSSWQCNLYPAGLFVEIALSVKTSADPDPELLAGAAQESTRLVTTLARATAACNEPSFRTHGSILISDSGREAAAALASERVS